jgi:hypothetical protein
LERQWIFIQNLGDETCIKAEGDDITRWIVGTCVLVNIVTMRSGWNWLWIVSNGGVGLSGSARES